MESVANLKDAAFEGSHILALGLADDWKGQVNDLFYSEMSVEGGRILIRIDNSPKLFVNFIPKNGLEFKLETPVFQFTGEKRKFTNNDFIRAFADTEAVHVDDGVLPITDSLNRIFFGNNAQDMQSSYTYALFEIGKTILHLAKNLLNEAKILSTDEPD